MSRTRNEEQHNGQSPLNANPSLAIQPAEHFFIGIGPRFATDISSKTEGEEADKDTALGVMTQVGGYF